MPIYRNKICFTDLPKIYIDCVDINFVDNIKNLGFYSNSTMSCVNHINSVVSIIYATLRNLIYFEVCRLLVLQLIVPIISYSETIFGYLDVTLLHKHNVAFNNAAKYVLNMICDHILLPR